MKLTRQQRINSIAASMITELHAVAIGYQKILAEGLDIQPVEGYPHLKATGDEVKAAMGDNAKELQIVIDFILHGKSNKIKKA